MHYLIQKVKNVKLRVKELSQSSKELKNQIRMAVPAMILGVEFNERGPESVRQPYYNINFFMV